MQYVIVRVFVFYLLWQLLCQVVYLLLHWLIPVAFAPGHILFLLVAIIPAIAVFIALRVVTRQTFRRCFGLYGFAKKGIFKESLTGFVLSGTLWAFNIAVDIVNHRYFVLGIYQSRFLTYWGSVLVFFLFTALTEETVFRGYVFQTVEQRWGSLGALLCSSFLFGLFHITWTSQIHPLEHVGTFLHGFVAGLFYSSAFLVGRRMWFPLGLHWGWDFAVSLFSNNYSLSERALVKYQLLPGSYGILGASYWTEMILRLVVSLLLLRIAINKEYWQKLPTKTGRQILKFEDTSG